MKTQGVKEIRNINVRRNGVLKRTNSYVLTFNTPILPNIYVPNPLRCYNCQFFGHHESRCTRKKCVQTVERLVDWGLTSHQQLRSYGDGTSVYSPIRQTEKPATPGLQGEWHNHCTRKASQTVEKRNTAVMIATLRKQQSASTAVAHTQLFHMTVRLGTKKSALLRSVKNCRTAIVHDKQELCQHHKKCWHTSQTS